MLKNEAKCKLLDQLLADGFSRIGLFGARSSTGNRLYSRPSLFSTRRVNSLNIYSSFHFNV